MRVAFVNTLLNLLECGENLHVLTGDLGYGLLDPIQKRFPLHFTNVGVAEANMVGLAAGMAMSGTRVFCYSIAPFIIFRALDQIRCDLCSQELSVTLVAAGGGVAYGFEGMTHYALEDLAIARALPGLTIYVPADPLEAGILTEAAAQAKGPVYLRLGAKNEPKIYPDGCATLPGHIECLVEGADIAIIANGTMVKRSIQAAEQLRPKGLTCAVYSLHTVKPLDYSSLTKISHQYKAILTVEEHFLINGVGAAVAEFLIESGYKGRFGRLGWPDRYPTMFGTADWMRDEAGLRPQDIASKALNLTQAISVKD